MQELYHPTISQPQHSKPDSEGLILSLDVLDRLIGKIRCGAFIALHGSRICHDLSELLCVRSQLPNIEVGLESSVVFVDGGNLFDPYLISMAARMYGLKPEKILKNIWVSRAFTAHQMTTLITEKLSEILEREHPKIVAASNIAALYCDSGIGLWEAKQTFNKITRYLWKLAHEKQILVVTTSISSRNQRKKRFEQYLLGRADIVVRIKEDNPCMKLILEKHISRPKVSMKVFFEEPVAQSLLEDFVEA